MANIKSKLSNKKWFGVIPNHLIKHLESFNLYDTRIQALNEITEKYVNDPDKFSVLTKKINDFIAYLFELSHEEFEVEDESIAYECVSLVHEILK
mmetsp:Transcript_19764/g.22948  ORF Transcript_19764/g.22948 Transcript_19764/m.22948 type:complete len:95 (+) Transcript_19764:132-416(+)